MASQDPEGKRIARTKAASAAEALELLSLAKFRVATLDSDTLAANLAGCIRDLRRLHDTEAAKGDGHLDPRKKYKGRSQHLAIEHERGVIGLYLDESGKAHPSLYQPVFVLAGVALDQPAATDYTCRADDLKRSFGIDPNTCLHASQIEKGLDEFAFGGDAGRQAEFQAAVRDLIVRSDFRLLGAILRKDVLAQHAQQGLAVRNLPPGLYEMALTFLAERFVDMLHADQVLKPCGTLIFESIGNLEDALHQRAFADLLIHGSEFVSSGCFRGWLRPGCEFRTKRGSHPLELADLAARSMLVWTRAGFPLNHEFVTLWGSKVSTRNEVEKGKFGVKIFPDLDIRDDVLRFRERILDVQGREGS